MCRLLPNPRTKIHQIKYIDLDPSSERGEEVLAVSTEDGRIIFFSPKKLQTADGIPYGEAVGQLGGRKSGLQGRIKDFEILTVGDQGFLIVTGGSDGIVRVWWLRGKDLSSQESSTDVGKLLGFYETGNRITCLRAFVMLPAEDPMEESEDEEDGAQESSSESEEDY